MWVPCGAVASCVALWLAVWRSCVPAAGARGRRPRIWYCQYYSVLCGTCWPALPLPPSLDRSAAACC